MGRSLAAVRSITAEEAAVVERTLAVAATDDAALRLAQLARSLKVVGCCGCGCSSVDFLTLPSGQIPRIAADAVAKSESGEDLGVIVWAHEDQLVGLEVFSYGDSPAPLPAVASISGYGGTSDAA